MSRDPIEPYNMQGRHMVQCLLALLKLKGCPDGLKGFQGHLTITENIRVLLWSSLRFIS
jgi:hypothetical protein